MIVRELITVLGFSADEAPLDRYAKAVDGLKKSILALSAGATAAAGALYGIVQTTADQAVQMSRSAASVGVGVEQYQRLAAAVKTYGTDIGDLNDTLGQLAQVSRDAMGGSKGQIDNFKQLGISVADLKKKDPQQILMMVADGLKGIEDSTQRLALTGALLGEDSAKKMGPLLMQGADAIRDLGQAADDAGVVIGEDGVKKALAYRSAMTKLLDMIQGFKNYLAVEIFPTATEWMERLSSWIKKNKELIKSKLLDFLKGLMAGLKIVAVVSGVLFVIMDKLVTLLGGYERAIRWATLALVAFAAVSGLNAVMALVAMGNQIKIAGGLLTWFGNSALLAWLKAAAPVALLIAGLAAVILILEDLVGWANGKDSLFGRMFPNLDFEQVKEKIMWIMVALASLIGIIAFVAGGWVIMIAAAIGIAIGLFIGHFEEIKAAFINLGTAIGAKLAGWFFPLIDGWETAKAKITSGFRAMVDTLMGWTQKLLGTFDKITGGAKKVMNFVKFWEDDPEQSGAQIAGAYIGGGAAGPQVDARRRVNQVQNSRSQNVSVGEVAVNIQGSTNMSPAELAQATQAGIDQALRRQVENASESFDGEEDY